MERIRNELTDYRETGMSVMEISHRAQPILEATRSPKEQQSETGIGIEEESELHHHRNARSIKPNPSRLPAFF
ncbi:MAG: hypothetical protein MI684_00125 [Chlorobiales bacterium]|nr:hypothetical protein [Chlorobiales bacterium]